ncbi:gamma-glutamyl-gamma-aminobutyrate hydrolase family protein [Zhongshania guokunii]|uniref:Gamma-glutamyl-gamma-aminobutyrate hydrolase family protein n=1 Tax=Zhongshania guokunii TaxID=641783 RepID=A0ABV3U2K6_9GAMM
MNRPLIGVTGDDTRLPLAWWFIRFALQRCGAEAYRLTPRRSALPDHLDAIIISGGDDIDQRLYLPDAPEIAPINRERDRFEMIALELSLSRGLPILGICRGAQLLNVVLGGTLHSDLTMMRRLTSNKRMLLPRKTLHLETYSKLFQIFGKEQCKINSLHHQAIKDLGQGLRVAGRDADYIIQAVEDPEHRCRIGVQWHPEYLPFQLRQLHLFRHLVASARR